MSWLALLFVGLGVADLAQAALRRPIVPECLGATVVIFLGLAAGLTGPKDVIALLVAAVAVVAWGQTVTRAFGGRLGAWVPLAVLGVAVALALLLAGAASAASGVVGSWLESSPLGVLRSLTTDRFLLVLGLVLVQLSTGNVIVRLVLAATHTLNPVPRPEDRPPLKGGRLLGPMERLLILGLGLAGQVTAASVVVAAKGLLRWPELQSSRREHHPGIHEVTEYFLVGSFVSWLVPLGSLVLLA